MFSYFRRCKLSHASLWLVLSANQIKTTIEQYIKAYKHNKNKYVRLILCEIGNAHEKY